ncbi:glutathione S-transferase [Sistotremastrum niveocremeum HHB9708]|uniref:Glutathione S-transferase n=2 Tax=Sistotremastraceae TaxID=3402574 RepID=A0A164MMN5_9AGAM|nr:glutathione S-transferase [Sistotremastrum niveocremeum HHB9708]KZT40354.1 glutathione S-transferase [Sistotremastrum suecicum HHB10207 ss-3]
MSAASKAPITLYTAPTANGFAVSILLDELKTIYGGPDYEVIKMSIRDQDFGVKHNQVKNDWFIKLNPNGRIPTIVHDGFSVFETSAIILYLAAQFDKECKFSSDPSDTLKYSEELQWLFFAHGGIGPMEGQALHFIKWAPEDIPYAQKRYLDETKRLFGVLEIRLRDRDYLTGPGRGRFALADMKAFPWVFGGARPHLLNVDLTEWPAVKAWVNRIAERPAVQSGSTVATTGDIV